VAPVGRSPAATTTPSASTQHPNIVLVLTDDLSLDLLPYMPQVQALATRGLTFDDYFVSDSLCCPSRASIFTGNFPHDTGVFDNVPSGGGFETFYRRGEQQTSFNVTLQRAGYMTAMMGKYLNGYLEPGQDSAPLNYVPPGWNEWDVAGSGYAEFDYALNENGTFHEYGDSPQDYLTDVIADKGVQFIDRAAAASKPFFLELATFAPHRPYTPAPRDANDFPGLVAPEPPNFDVLPTNAPAWLSGHPPLDAAKLRKVNQAFRKRAQAVRAIDQMIESIEDALESHGLTGDTYLVFTSDNGLHTGEYRLTPGKLTAYDTDIHVPLVVAGPGVPVDRHTDLFAQNVDLAKTFADIAHAPAMVNDGHSLLPLLEGQTPGDWRNAALVEHHGPTIDARDPDRQDRDSGNPTTYEAMRTDRYLYVEYLDGEREFYDLENDPYELHNLASELSATQLATLHDDLAQLENCHTGDSCWAAAHVAPVAGMRATRARSSSSRSS
jgi:arylsulfatase A-like enzyme